MVEADPCQKLAEGTCPYVRSIDMQHHVLDKLPQLGSEDLQNARMRLAVEMAALGVATEAGLCVYSDPFCGAESAASDLADATFRTLRMN